MRLAPVGAAKCPNRLPLLPTPPLLPPTPLIPSDGGGGPHIWFGDLGECCALTVLWYVCCCCCWMAIEFGFCSSVIVVGSSWAAFSSC